jgi:hypothetical protein
VEVKVWYHFFGRVLEAVPVMWAATPFPGSSPQDNYFGRAQLRPSRVTLPILENDLESL